eukprot:4651506-Prymnesium_polylepis.1
MTRASRGDAPPLCSAAALRLGRGAWAASSQHGSRPPYGSGCPYIRSSYRCSGADVAPPTSFAHEGCVLGGPSWEEPPLPRGHHVLWTGSSHARQ